MTIGWLEIVVGVVCGVGDWCVWGGSDVGVNDFDGDGVVGDGGVGGDSGELVVRRMVTGKILVVGQVVEEGKGMVKIIS